MSDLAIAELAPDVLDRMDARRIDFMVGGVLAAPGALRPRDAS